MEAIKKLLRCKMLFYILFCFSPIDSVSASQSHTSPSNCDSSKPFSSEEQAVLNQIISYLSQHSFTPFLRNGESEYAHVTFIKDSNNNNTHAIGMVTQGNNSYFTLFSINKRWFSREIKTELVYITSDDAISPILFRDIFQVMACFLPKTLSNFHIFIERKEDPTLPNESRLQKWTFFNQQESAEQFVELTEDGRGGTYCKIIHHGRLGTQ